MYGKWTKDEDLIKKLREAVKQSFSASQVFKMLGLKASGANYAGFRSACQELQLDTSHFDPRKNNKPPTGKTFPLSELLVNGRAYENTHRLKLRIIKEGLLPPVCSICGIDSWNEKPLSLQLDHIDGDRLNNFIENLRLLCPNCHSQTDTYCGKNIGKNK